MNESTRDILQKAIDKIISLRHEVALAVSPEKRKLLEHWLRQARIAARNFNHFRKSYPEEWRMKPYLSDEKGS